MSVISPISDESLNILWSEIRKNNYINPDYYRRYDVKKGLRNADDTGVMAGLTRVCSVEGYYLSDGERVPKEGKLVYRGINVEDIVDNSLSYFSQKREELVCVFDKNLPRNHIKTLILIQSKRLSFSPGDFDKPI